MGFCLSVRNVPSNDAPDAETHAHLGGRAVSITTFGVGDEELIDHVVDVVRKHGLRLVPSDDASAHICAAPLMDDDSIIDLDEFVDNALADSFVIIDSTARWVGGNGQHVEGIYFYERGMASHAAEAVSSWLAREFGTRLPAAGASEQRRRAAVETSVDVLSRVIVDNDVLQAEVRRLDGELRRMGALLGEKQSEIQTLLALNRQLEQTRDALISELGKPRIQPDASALLRFARFAGKELLTGLITFGVSVGAIVATADEPPAVNESPETTVNNYFTVQIDRAIPVVEEPDFTG